MSVLNCAENEDSGCLGKRWFKTPGACSARRMKKAECDDETKNEDKRK
jgi:hypothetical protein